MAGCCPLKIASVVVNRNDGYKDFDRGIIHFKSFLELSMNLYRFEFIISITRDIIYIYINHLK